jgi:hypothetical protein
VNVILMPYFYNLYTSLYLRSYSLCIGASVPGSVDAGQWPRDSGLQAQAEANSGTKLQPWPPSLLTFWRENGD